MDIKKEIEAVLSQVSDLATDTPVGVAIVVTHADGRVSNVYNTDSDAVPYSLVGGLARLQDRILRDHFDE